jgi:hypothetical protein
LHELLHSASGDISDQTTNDIQLFSETDYPLL